MNATMLAKVYAEHRRLEILRALAADPAFCLNDDLLQSALKLVGLTASITQIQAELDWLKEAGLITVEKLGPIYKATITKRGQDVAEGNTVATGVSRPRPAE